MKIDFDTQEITKGLLRKQTFYNVILTCQLSEEEQAIIKKEKLKDYVVFECVPCNAREDRPEEIYFLYVRDLIKGRYEILLPTRVDANSWQQDCIEQLKTLKSYIEQGGDTAPEKRSIEL